MKLFVQKVACNLPCSSLHMKTTSPCFVVLEAVLVEDLVVQGMCGVLWTWLLLFFTHFQAPILSASTADAIKPVMSPH